MTLRCVGNSVGRAVAGLSIACLGIGALSLRRAPVAGTAELVAGSFLATGLVLLGIGLQMATG